MEAEVAKPTDTASWFPQSKAEQQRVLAQLELILASQHFSHSRRSQSIFRYIVDKSLQGQASLLKERTLGIEVFGRTPDYDTNADPIVRTTVGEIRKRIAQYYYESGNPDEIRIDVPSGTYRAHFRLPTSEVARRSEAPPPQITLSTQDVESSPSNPTSDTQQPAILRRRRSWKLLLLFAGVISVVLAALYLPAKTSMIEHSWGNIISGKSPILISVGIHGAAVTGPGSKAYSAFPSSSDGKEWSAIDHMQAYSITFSEMQAFDRIVRIVDRRRLEYRVQTGSAATFADMRQGPAILVGGLNNPWTLRAQKRLRYQMAGEQGVDWIFDSRNPNVKKYLVDTNQLYNTLGTDYAIVARFFDESTQQPTLIVAGLGEDGTKAASEFITNEKLLHDALADSLPSKGKNFEVVLGTEVVNGVSGPPKVLAKEVW